MQLHTLFERLKKLLLAIVLVVITLLGVRTYDALQGPPLEPWHKLVPDELSAEQLDKSDWTAYLRAEQQAFIEVKQEVTDKLDAEERIPLNRYYDRSPIYPEHFSQDWNRSYELMPAGKPVGAVVLLHGLTDSPYSLRHIAEDYRRRGFVAVGIRLPGHGTVPGGLTNVDWEQWLAATRLAVREARRAAGADVPLQLVGFSNGGALAMKYTLDTLDDSALTRPSRVVLISPMIGITRFARFAGYAGWPAIFPAFAKTAWLNVMPEFNPFKYNSFPVKAARQSYLLTHVLQQQISKDAQSGKLAQLPPLLAFQSVVDSTVSTRAVVSSLFNQLPANGSQLVLFDINRSAYVGPLLRPAVEAAVERLLPPSPRHYQTTVITNASPDQSATVAQITQAGQTEAITTPLGLDYPAEFFSLSHVALPFPTDDSLYGRNPQGAPQYGIHLGRLAARGETGALVVSMDQLMRVSSNPFYPYMLQRIAE
ncbi:alpha/beta hydrolase [Hafnia psychrotolerans]|uniref:Membrane protein n=1 Tax=Hafnia psychrotolerans TaxID=1477018 RepID=A0ABQ1H4L8_9GAMM|nr:alpha/beta hydrolase [Hafnia psychrotolerans]GGA57392.1 membrane protein [Hafnia psychrotolerans]